MRLTHKTAFAALLLLGLAVLGFVLFSQYVQGYRPCEWCLRQRVPWGIIIGIGAIGLIRPMPVLLWLAAAVLVVGAAFGVVHFGIEQGWWETGCSIGPTGEATTIEQLRMQLLDAPPCNIVRWRLFGLSMASYNFLVSAGAAVAVVLAARILRKPAHG